MMHRAYRCLSCGRDILVVQTLDETTPINVVSWDVEIGHRGPVDAACRLVLEVLADELRANINAATRQAEATLRGMLG